ncbi:MAG TPA: serine hydrolase domain-containing protein [Candidatus Baltobacteraceae bacterium]|nr:serine hydrolase domain-containing protein [Candidatus Baltobacteraceae bacterium]
MSQQSRSMNRRTFSRLLALGCAAFPLRAPAGSTASPRLDDEMSWSGVPGVAFAHVDRTSIAPTAAGLRDVAGQLPVTTSTLFEAASLSKPVFAYAVLRLVANGTLALDRALDSYLSAPYPIGDPRAGKITARHVLSHTSGLPNWRHATSEPLTLAFEPGTQYRYSGEGYYFLQAVVEHVTGQSTAHLMCSTLDELGMRDSSYIWADADAANCALPYDGVGKPLRHDTALLGQQLVVAGEAKARPLAAWTTAEALAALPSVRPAVAAVPWNAMPNVAWSLLTTAVDYARFVQALLKQPDNPMFTPVIQLSRYVWRGLGVALQKRAGSTAFFHTGANPGFKALMFGDFSSARGFVSFANSDGGFPLNMQLLEDAVGLQPAILYLEQP